MLYFTSFEELADCIDLNLFVPPSSVQDSHLVAIEITENSTLESLGTNLGRAGNHQLILDAATSSWALLDDFEADVYGSIGKSAFSTLSSQFPALAENALALFVKALFRRGLLAVDGVHPVDPLFYESSPKYRETVLIELLVSEKCNLECAYCQADVASAKRAMSREIAERSVKRSFMLPYQTLLFEFSGGEPLLNFELVEWTVGLIEEIAHATGKQTLIQLCTNGTLLDEEKVRFIKKHDIRLSLSLDGPPRIHDLSRPLAGGHPSSPLVQRAIKFLRQYEVPIGVVLTVNKWNHLYANDIVAFLADLNPGVVKMNNVTLVGRAQSQESIAVSSQQYLEFMRLVLHALVNSRLSVNEFNIGEIVNRLITRFRDYRCMRANCNAGYSYFVVDPRGTIYPCAQMTGFPHAELGNILADSRDLQELRDDNDFLTRYAARRLSQVAGCRECGWRGFCQGGCMAENLAESQFDSASMRSPNCEFYRGMYREVLETTSLTPDAMQRYLRSASFMHGPGWLKNDQYFPG